MVNASHEKKKKNAMSKTGDFGPNGADTTQPNLQTVTPQRSQEEENEENQKKMGSWIAPTLFN